MKGISLMEFEIIISLTTRIKMGSIDIMTKNINFWSGIAFQFLKIKHLFLLLSISFSFKCQVL